MAKKRPSKYFFHVGINKRYVEHVIDVPNMHIRPDKHDFRARWSHFECVKHLLVANRIGEIVKVHLTWVLLPHPQANDVQVMMAYCAHYQQDKSRLFAP